MSSAVPAGWCGQGRSAIGITPAARSAAFPDVPTTAQQGLPGFGFAPRFGFFAHAGTPPEAVARLEAAVLHALDTPAVQDRLRQAAAEPIPRGAAAFGPWFAREVERCRGMVASGRLARLD